ncbi:hypothetical protein R70211_06753 [Paraburkholderia domus]|uniref:Uncharacterized protein n=1 Tax=Paraburkholderia domus TaxID=2793075 RepID=A0A9N8R3N9_9BURK|nr:hypothetical protein R75471_00919 [Paraburkholderia domus]CAE6876609.1 hypothetical protein R70199_02184 [Paraburkholderia domus]CAE6958411.1 hypothetical protein R70211_06753 [Paraburkholderia domus]
MRSNLRRIQSYRVELANGVAYEIPVNDRFRRDTANGQLANQGFHFFEQGQDDDGDDRATHRQHYYRLLNPDMDAQS